MIRPQCLPNSLGQQCAPPCARRRRRRSTAVADSHPQQQSACFGHGLTYVKQVCPIAPPPAAAACCGPPSCACGCCGSGHTSGWVLGTEAAAPLWVLGAARLWTSAGLTTGLHSLSLHAQPCQFQWTGCCESGWRTLSSWRQPALAACSWPSAAGSTRLCYTMPSASHRCGPASSSMAAVLTSCAACRRWCSERWASPRRTQTR